MKLKSRLILAPMAGISDLPFRMINREFGCELGFVEMINARSISHGSSKTKQMLATLPQDRPLGVQLLGVEPAFILKALSVMERYSFDLLDFNAACPVKKVVRRGEGAGLLQQPKKLCEILKILVRESTHPVTVKIRTGWDKDTQNARDVALYAQDAGVKGIFVHGRTRIQGYSGNVDYASIRQVKEAVTVPVIASGDIFNCHLAKKMFDETGCDGLMVARGALGNPWIFRQIEEFQKTGAVPHRAGKLEIAQVMDQHLTGCINFYGEGVGVVIFRKFFSWYTSGFRKIRLFREKSSRVKTQEGMRSLIDECTAI